ncbi:MAG: ribose transport system substrate-binding protein [Bryobacterales bacterium]|nr:ribose transport system substrate-binding protein [Bryobacterales bacterium]
MQCKWVVLFAASLLASSCNRNVQRRIAVIPKGTAHVFWQSVHAGAVAAGREFHAEIVWDGPPNETDYSRQLEIVDSMLNRHVEGMVVAAADRTTLNASLDRAAREKIPVVVFDSGVDSTNYVSFVATDNFAAGKLGARKLAALLNGKGTIAMIQNAPGSASTMDRERGFKEAMAQEFSGIEIVAEQYSMSNRAKAMSAAENILTAHPQLDGLFASSEPSSVGAAQAIKSRNLTGKLKFVAFDSSEGLVEDLNAGVIDALVAQDPFRMGYEAVRTVTEKLNGKTPDKKIDLSAAVITKADLDKAEVKLLLHPDLEKYLGK